MEGKTDLLLQFGYLRTRRARTQGVVVLGRVVKEPSPKSLPEFFDGGEGFFGW